MGKTFSTGLLTNGLWQDSSNNIGIGGAANASFKLQVSGSVNLAGNVTTTGAQFVQNGFYLTNTNAGATAGYTNLWGATDGIFFGLRNGTGGGKFIFQSATSYDYTFPAATGTLALTSNLSAYLPLAGGTLTGALSGTSATFSGNGLFGGSTNAGNAGAFTLSVGVPGTTAGGIQLWAATNQSSFLQFGDSTTSADNYRGYVGYNHATDTLSLGTASTDKLTIASTGAATFSSSLSVPTATISSSITSPMFRVTPTGTFRVNTDGDAILGYMLRSGSWKGNAENNLAFATDGAYGISFFTNGSASEKMIITSGGNVGIGITSPQSPLEVYSTTGYASSWRFGILSSSPDYPTIRLYAYGSNKLSMIGNNGDGSLWFFVNGNLATQGTAAMTMTSGGVVNVLNDLGVGTATPSGKIHGVGINTSGSNNVLYLENAVATIMLQVRNDGNIRINSTVYNGTTAGSTRTLFVGDGGYFLGGISSIRASKDNIQNIENVNWIYQLNPVTFNYRKKDDEGNYTNETFDESNYGLIAEDTQPIADFLINYNDKEDGSKEMIGIEYSRLITPMLKAIQEQQAQIEELRQIVATK